MARKNYIVEQIIVKLREVELHCNQGKRYGLSHINLHALRHTQASVLYLNNVDPVTISRRLGHSRVSTTQDIYCHLLEQADDTARDAIGSTLFGERKKQPPTPEKQRAK